jgi:hypothetical protein
MSKTRKQERGSLAVETSVRTESECNVSLLQAQETLSPRPPAVDVMLRISAVPGSRGWGWGRGIGVRWTWG